MPQINTTNDEELGSPPQPGLRTGTSPTLPRSRTPDNDIPINEKPGFAACTPESSGMRSSRSSTTGAGAEPFVPSSIVQTDTAAATAATTDLERLEKASPAPSGAPDPALVNYKPKTINFWLVILSNFVALFLVALDRTILATAIPRITDEFKSLGDIGWYGSAYMLTTASSQLVFGRIFKFYDQKRIVVFEIGSLICGVAQDSPTLIVGRAIAGFGSAGIFTGTMLVMIAMIPLHKRPMFQSAFGIAFGLASVAGPLLGGALTEGASWRWCFYINLPIGGVALALLFFMLDMPCEPQQPVPWYRHIARLDPLGVFFFVPSIVCLLLALQWGGATYAWDDWRIIVLFVVFGTAFAGFAAVQILMPDTAQVPVRIITQRSMLAGSWFMFFLAGTMMLAVYYVPLWFQAVKDFTPIQSGIYTLPLVLSLVASSFISGFVTQKIGYYVPSMMLCPVLMAVGQGLMSTWTPASGTPEWAGYQFLMGFGLGFGMQTVGLAVQAVLPREDVSTGVAISFFAQQLGAAVVLCAGQAILNNLLVQGLRGVPGPRPEDVIRAGATEMRGVVPAGSLARAIGAYNGAVTRTFLAGMACALAALVCAACMQWKCIKMDGAGQAKLPPEGVAGSKAGEVGPGSGPDTEVETETSGVAAMPERKRTEDGAELEGHAAT